MIFRHFLLNVNEANAFVVGCEITSDALLVDVGEYDPRIPEFLAENGLRLTTVFITHDHYDHAGGVVDLLLMPGVTVYSGSGMAGGRPVRRLNAGDLLRVGAIDGQVVSTPGHTPEGISLVLPDMVFTGDALFSGSVGGTTNARNYATQIAHIRENIFSLPEAYEVHCGHGPSSTIGVEKRHNPFFQ
jgi:glyoxylase-like metal-dependent hydrolase (beta-lactamase superfamily II)